MEAIVSDLTKKPFKNWKNLFQLFLDQPALSLAQQRDDGLSCFLMGLYHEYGFGFKRDYDAALDYFRLGANKRDPLCLYKLYEIHSGKNFYGIEVDHDIALLYLVWAVTYMFPIYGSYMCLDLDLELQAYYKHTLKMDKEHVFQLIDEYEDDIFGHDKELIKCVFGFLIEFICPKPGFETQVEYQKMIDELANIADKGDSRFAALFLFKCVIWDFKGVTDKNHKKISSLIRRRKCVSFIFQQLQTVFDYVTLLNKKHTIFSRLLHFHSIEIFLQIKYNCDTDDILNKTEACEYLVNLLYSSLGILENSFTRSMAIQFMAKSYMNETSARVDLSHALSVIESSRQLPGFVEQDFPFVLGGRLYSKLGKNMMSEQYFEKYMSYFESKPNLSVTFYEQGKYYQFHKRDNEKALEAYIKGLSLSKNVNTFMQECYARKCRDKIVKLIGSNEGLYKKFLPSLENDTSYLSLNNAI